jgi:asparagine synthase (glutamine-hydrolysing)
MCGIFGVALDKTFISKELFAESLELINHRGPDSTGTTFHNIENVGFGHKRLSIVDLSKAGSQPMDSQDYSYQIIFNGEIYNFREIRDQLKKLDYRFRSQTDTEVLLNSYIEWGVDCVKKLKGMFAFAILDKNKKNIFIARDRAGEKPLYYSISSNNFLFSSEIKPLIHFEKKLNFIDPDSFSFLFEHGFTQRNKSIFRDIFKLKPGHSLLFNLEDRSYEINNYWDITKKVNNNSLKNSNLSETELLNKLEHCLESAVLSQLYADVPIGIMLSGGLDSSLITALAARHQKKINTFTVSFSGHGTFDESSHAKIIADKFKTNHYQLEAKEISPEILDHLPYFYDDPMFDSSMIPSYLLSEVISKNFKVALSGDGGDELFGGYNHYKKLLRLKYYSAFIPLFFRQSANSFYQHLMPLGSRGRKTIELFSSNFETSYPNNNEFFSTKEQILFFQSEFLRESGKSLIKNQDFSSKITNFSNRATFYDFQNYLSEDILVKIDRASMAHGLEIRAPFLDKDMIEFAFTEVPPDLKLNLKDKKILLKKLGLKILPASFSIQRKQGFSIPLGNFLSEKKWFEYFAQTILDSDPILINKRKCMDLLEDKSRIHRNAGRLFALVFYISWMRRFNPCF